MRYSDLFVGGWKDYKVQSNFDRFGATYRHSDRTYVDLEELDVPFVPAPLPSFVHFWMASEGMSMEGFAVETRNFSCRKDDLGMIRDFLDPAKGIHYLLYVEDHVDVLVARSFLFQRGTIQCDLSLVQPKTMSDWLDEWNAESDRYPHTCPRCGKPSFNGIAVVDCSVRCH